MKTFLLNAILVSMVLAAPIQRQMPPKDVPGAVLSITDINVICLAPSALHPQGWPRPGYTKTVRPPSSWTNPRKIAQMATLGITAPPKDEEYDHRVPLEILGDPRSPLNLWPESWPEARLKDRLENAVAKDICTHKLTLKQGQAIFLGDFWAEYDRRFGK